MDKLKKLIFEEFAYHHHEDPREYKYKIGWWTGTSLSGFIAGVISASIIFFTVYFIKMGFAF